MKEGFDKEIDSLLRRGARGAVKSFADGGAATAAAAAHLDADELGAFAEGALPAPARLAAASHLADCDRCRGGVVALTRALGGGAEVKQAAAIPASAAAGKPASWGAWVAALFSPRVLRYAAPVLALSVVAVVSFVALRTREGGALNTATSPRPQTGGARVQPEAVGPAGIGAAANSNQAGLVAQDQKDPSASPESRTAAARPPSVGRGPNVGEAPVVAAPVEDTAEPPPPPASVATEAPPEMAKAAPRPVVVEAEPPAKSDAKSDGRDRQKATREAEAGDEVASGYSAEQRNRAAQNRAGEVQMPDGGTRNQRRSADNNASNVYGGNAGASAAQPRDSERDDRAGSAARRARPNTRAEQREEMDEVARVGDTREAAGHRFRREGSAWVDVKYRPSMASTGVRRGTEAFRALVADVPVIGRVAGQLSGEVVVVVSGRAYRIR